MPGGFGSFVRQAGLQNHLLPAVAAYWPGLYPALSALGLCRAHSLPWRAPRGPAV